MRQIQQHSLKAFNTFGVDANAEKLLELQTTSDVEQLDWNGNTDIVLGGGSNVLFVGDVPGTVYLNRIRGLEVLDEDRDKALTQAGGGENWHTLVRWSVRQGLGGLENLSLIPGLAGAAPMQNIGAYGVELCSVLHSLTAWDLRDGKWREFNTAECQFAYRNSRFKSESPGRFLITAIRLLLDKQFHPRLSYAGLGEELEAMEIRNPTPADVSDAVIRIRQRKLPDPEQLGNAGSFFKNPMVTAARAEALRDAHPDLPAHPHSHDAVKISAGWLIEHCGWKGHREGDMGVSDQHALVLVNHGQASGQELLRLAERISNSVQKKFGISLEIEPRIIRY